MQIFLCDLCQSQCDYNSIFSLILPSWGYIIVVMLCTRCALKFTMHFNDCLTDDMNFDTAVWFNLMRTVAHGAMFFCIQGNVLVNFECTLIIP